MDEQSVCVSEQALKTSPTSVRERSNQGGDSVLSTNEQGCSDFTGLVSIVRSVPRQSADAIVGIECVGDSLCFESLRGEMTSFDHTEKIIFPEPAIISNESQRDGCCDVEMNEAPSSSSDQVRIASSLAPKVDQAIDDREQEFEVASENDSLVENFAHMNSVGDAERHASHATLESLLKHCMEQYLVKEDYLLDSSQEDVEDDDSLMNMLREREHDLSVKHLDEFVSTIVEDNVAGGEPRRLSFLQILRKKLVLAGKEDAETFCQQFMWQNRAVLGKFLGRRGILSTGNVSKKGFETAMEIEQSLGEDFQKGCETTLTGYSGSRGNCDNLALSGRVEEQTREKANSFGVGDLVWAKVKSHPWWPGQVFDAADASVPARKTQKSHRVLVAFFGDGTFGWLQQSQLIAFRPVFEEKVKQTTMKSFCRAVSEALLEVGRRVELGLRCAHTKGALHSEDTFPDENVGVRMGVRLYSHPDMSTARREKFDAKKALKFVRMTACCPSYPLESGLECAELCGHIYGFRSFRIPPENSMGNDYLPQRISVARKKGKSAEFLKRSVDVEDGSNAERDKGAKRPHLDTDIAMEKHLFPSRSDSPTVLSSNMSAMESPSSKESDQIKETETKLCEGVTESALRAKGKRLYASLDAGAGKRAKQWHSLGPVSRKDPKVSGVSRAAMSFPSPEDDSKTLFDLTGYLFVKEEKKKMRCVLKNNRDMLSSSSEKFDQPSVVLSDEPLSDEIATKVTVPEIPSKTDRPLFEESLNDQPCLKLESACEEEESRDTPLGIPKGPNSYQSASAFSKETSDPEESKTGNDHIHPVEQDVKDWNKIFKKKKGSMCVHAEESDTKAKRAMYGTTDKGRAKFPRDKEEDVKEPFMSSKSGDSIKKAQFVEQDVKDRSKILKKTKETMCICAEEKNIKAKRVKDDRAIDKGRLNSSRDKKGVVKEPVKSSNSPKAIMKVECVFKGAPLSKKSADKSSAQRLVPVAGLKLKDARRAEVDYRSPAIHTETSTGSFVELLNSLQGIARDPVSSADMKSSLHGVMSVFLKFRSMVFLKSAEYGNVGVWRMGNRPFDKWQDANDQSGKLGRPNVATQDACSIRKAAVKAGRRSDVEYSMAEVASSVADVETRSDMEYSTTEVAYSVADVETGSSVTPFHLQRVMVGSQKPRQELAAMGKKSDDGVLQCTCVGQAPLKCEGDVSQGTYASKEAENRGKIVDRRHLSSTSVKHHIASAKRFQKVCSKAKFVMGIFMQFPEDFTMPSEEELAAKFDRFGPLQAAGGVRIHKDSSTAQVFFKHSNDAEAALRHAKQNRLFGHTNVSYRLRHFSPPSRNASTTMASAKYGGSLVKGVKPMAFEETGRKAGIVRSSVSVEAEPGIPIMATLSTTVDTVTIMRNSSSSLAEQEGTKLTAHALEPDQQGSCRSGAMLPEGSKSTRWQRPATPKQGGLQVVNDSDVNNLSMVSPANVAPSPPPPSAPAAPTPPPSALPPPGDIRDQMLNLLQQLSVLVSSSSLIHRTP